MLHESVWLVSLALMGLVLAVFLFVYSQSHVREDDYTPLQKRAYRLRARLFWVLVVTLGPAMVYNLIDLPYGAARAHAAGTGVRVIEAVGHQWRWELSGNEVTAGQPVEFRVTSSDVNHGFGIYDTELRLVAQTQAMPGYINTLRHTFERAGTYRVLCMEYCGIVHHNMIAEITVTEP
ncbi:MAG: hypothetical protein KJ011_13310 [Burkholderiaceae bacterium]|nr:hypothetical protein [Burkholderiaceae bacterium]